LNTMQTKTMAEQTTERFLTTSAAYFGLMGTGKS